MVEKIHALLDGYLIGRARLKPSIKIMRGNHPEWMVDIRIDLRTLLIEAVLPENAEFYFFTVFSVEISDIDVIMQGSCISFTSSEAFVFNCANLSPLPVGDDHWWSAVVKAELDSYLFKLKPAKYQLKLKADAKLCPEKPYFHFYGNACSQLACDTDLQFKEFLSPVSCVVHKPSKGLLCLSSAEEFLPWCERLQAGFMLAHGRVLPSVLEVSGVDVVLYGYPKAEIKNNLPLLSNFRIEAVDHILRDLLQGFISLEPNDFQHVVFALRFYLLGKTADVPVEVRFLQLMVCVEAMDGIRDLDGNTTAAALGISYSAAKLLNCMRNKLIHGTGGYRQAFSEVLEEDFGGKLPKFGQGFDGVVIKDGNLEFAQLWLRLCERLDAFWCGYLKVDPSLLVHRSSWANIALLPAVDISLLATEVAAYKQVKEEKDRKREAKALKAKMDFQKVLCEKAELKLENKLLKEELQKLKDEIAQTMRQH